MDDYKANARPGVQTDPDIHLLLKEIENEKVPERLLKLAMELQAALAARDEKGPHGSDS